MKLNEYKLEDIFWLLMFIGTVACGILAFKNIVR